MVKRLIIPGLGGSGEGHWQRWWANYDPQAELVEQDDWEQPDLTQWLYRLSIAVRRNPGAILVGHSLGALLIPHLAARVSGLDIGAAILVAVPDAEQHVALRNKAGSFAPIPRQPLPFRSITVASSNDRLMEVGRAEEFAKAWGSRFFDIGHAGHINAASGYDSWLAGLRIADQLEEIAERTTGDATFPAQSHAVRADRLRPPALSLAS